MKTLSIILLGILITTNIQAQELSVLGGTSLTSIIKLDRDPRANSSATPKWGGYLSVIYQFKLRRFLIPIVEMRMQRANLGWTSDYSALGGSSYKYGVTHRNYIGAGFYPIFFDVNPAFTFEAGIMADYVFKEHRWSYYLFSGGMTNHEGYSSSNQSSRTFLISDVIRLRWKTALWKKWYVQLASSIFITKWREFNLDVDTRGIHWQVMGGLSYRPNLKWSKQAKKRRTKSYR